MYGAQNSLNEEGLNSSAIQNLAKEMNIQNLLKIYEMLKADSKLASKVAAINDRTFDILEDALAKYTCFSALYFDHDQDLTMNENRLRSQWK